MPKQRITKEMVVEAAFEIARKEGAEKVIVKNIAERLGCSVQPIYSYCSNMEGLREELVERTRTFMKDYIASRLERTNYFWSMGQAQIHFAKEEPNLFKMYFLRRRQDISSLQELYTKEGSPDMGEYLSQTLQISPEKARELHLNMIIYTMGIASILATTGSDIPEEEISDRLEKAYHAFYAQSREEHNE